MKTQSRAFDIVILPPEEICRKALVVSSRLQKRGGLFTLDGKHTIPHITVFAAWFSEHNLRKIGGVLKKIAVQTGPFAVSSLKYRQEGRGYVVVDYRASHALKDLRKRILEEIHVFCQECKEGVVDGWCNAHKKTWVPHLTFTKFSQYTPSGLSGIKEDDFSFCAKQVGLCVLGRYGTCKKIVSRFDFT